MYVDGVIPTKAFFSRSRDLGWAVCAEGTVLKRRGLERAP
jgi:hypothetical protein